MHRLFILFSKILKKFAFFCEGMGQTYAGHNDTVKDSSSRHDMLKDPDESYYGEQYLHWIHHALGQNLENLSVLDLGCGQGRLSISMAKSCKQVIGVDFTPKAIESAKLYAKEMSCSNVEFYLADVYAYAKNQPSSSVDVIIFTEVTFFLPSYKQVIKEIHRMLTPTGIAFISFRSQFFNILHSAQRQKWESVQMAISNREGYLWQDSTWFSWHTKEDIQVLLTNIGFKQTDCVGIGILSGIEGDPGANIIRPSLLRDDQRKQLMELEKQLSRQYVEQGRYILAIARK